MSRDQLLDLATELVESDSMQGVCLACGEIADGVEPDARKYTCETCGESKVYGAEEIVMRLAC
jgi:predicted RNA-binding Zn-ribbon protein involved in translation (DUF1610 family)